jgi:predicted AAA+ superfamily ATPase
MDIEILKRVLVDQKNDMQKVLDSPSLIPRIFDTQPLINAISIPNILIIVGIRRCGKSTFANLIISQINEPFTYLDFADERLSSFTPEDLNDIIIASEQLWGSTDLFLFDEIQNVPNWQLFINRLRRTKRIILTGSNSKMLSGELATHLTGRYLPFLIFPFSFKEYLDFKKVRFESHQKLIEFAYSTSGLANILQHLDGYYHEGGFPEVILLGPQMAMRIYEDIIYKDLIIHYRIRKIDSFREIAQYVISNFARPMTYASLSKIFSIKDKHTVAKYIRYLQEAYLIYPIERFSTSLKTSLLSPKIVYISDPGLLYNVKNRFDNERGRLMENLVAIELIRRKANQTPPSQIFYWRDDNKHDIDFLILQEQKVEEIIQVCNVSEERYIPPRELESMVYAAKDLRCKNLTLITSNLQGQATIEKYTVKFIPLWKWLLFL